MNASRFTAVMPTPESNPRRNPWRRLDFESQSESEAELSSSDSESDEDSSSASDASDEEEDEESGEESDELLTRSYPSSPSSSAASSSFENESDDDELDERSEFFLDKQVIRGAASLDDQDEFSFVPRAMRTDNIGIVAWLIPITGITTMIATEILACIYHFECADNYPTLSYAATFKPEGYAFTAGMCVTAILIFASIALFYWFHKLRGEGHATVAANGARRHYVPVIALLAGILAAVSLFSLAVMDMRNYHDAHITFTIVFFVAAWVTIIAVHQARRAVLLETESAKSGRTLNGGLDSSCGSLSDSHSLVSSLRRWKRLKFATAFALGKVLLLAGLTSTFLCMCCLPIVFACIACV